MRTALLSNVTVDMLARPLCEEGHEVWTAPGFGAWIETALNPPEALRAFDPELVCLLLDRRFAGGDGVRETLPSVREALGRAFPKAAVIVPDVAAHLADLGEAAYDERMWTVAKMPWSRTGLLELKKILAPVKKVLALDLDETLWRGVVSEVGVAGIVPDVAFQRRILELKERGVLLVALSKNDPEDVKPVWDDPRMVLKESDFAASVIGWDAKSVGLAAVARELNLAPDAFVFVDDNAGNRAEMRASRPEVAVAPFPPDLGVWFPPRAVTEEDLARTERYREEALRRESAAGLSYDGYLASLEIRTDVHEMAASEIPRVAQLSQKSNQFNVRTNRYAETDLARLIGDPDQLFVTLHARDRFGDLGLVAFVRAAPISPANSVYEILDWVMSCRAMNRRLEFTLEREVERLLAARGATAIRATWRRTAKNAPVAELFDAFGFLRTGETDGQRSYRKSLVV